MIETFGPPSLHVSRVATRATAAAVVSVGVGAGIVVSPVKTTAILCVLGALYLVRSPEPLLLGAVVVTAGAYRGLFFVGRVEFLDIPISVFDVLWVVALIKALPTVLERSPDHLRVPMQLFAALAIATVITGIFFGRDLYDILKFFRAELFLLGGYFMARALDQRGRRNIMRAMAVGGSITAASQIVTFLFAQRGVNVWALLGIQAFDTGDVYFGVNSTVIDLYRDLGITMNFAVLGALLLTATIMRRRLLFSWQCSLFLLGVCLAGIALSLTRTVWVALLVGLIVLFVRSGVSARTLLTLGIPILMIVTATSVIGARVFDLPVESTLERRLATFGDLPNQKSLEYRFNETQSALDHLGDNWFTGVGAVVVSVNEAGVIFQRNQLHNGFVHVLVAGGIFSVGSLCLVLGVGFSAAWRRSSRGESKDERLLGLALCASLGAMVVIAFVGGVWNDAFQTPIVGLILGLVVSPTEDRTAASESASEADRRPSPRS